MRKPVPANAFTTVFLCSIAAFLSTRTLPAASNGNIDAAHARFLTADGAVHLDNITNVNGNAWFAVQIQHDHSYEISAWAPYNNILQSDPSLTMLIREVDGTTAVPEMPTGNLEPEFFDTTTPLGVGGIRTSVANTGAGVSRQIKIHVDKYPSGTPAATVQFYIRVIDTTQMAARWTVNGYQAFFALNNLSNNGSASGSIVYYSQNGDFLASDAFEIPPNGSVQIVKPNGVAIGGQLVGGVRLVFSAGNVAQVAAQEYNFNAVSGQYLTFQFIPVFQSAAGVQF